MRLLILTQYYPPEIGAPQNRLHELAVRLLNKGIEVEVLTAMPNYPQMEIHEAYKNGKIREEIIDGIKVYRSKIFVSTSKSIIKRLLNYFSFVWTSYWRGRKLSNFDYLMVESPPLFLSYSATRLAKKLKAKLIFNVSDLWPESAEKLNLVNNKSLLKLAYNLEAKSYRKSFLVTCQTQGIADNIKKRFPEVKTHWLPNGVDLSFYNPETIQEGDFREKNGFSEKDVLFFYGGIVGYAQGLEIILKAASLTVESIDIQYIIQGSGPVKDDLIRLKQQMNLSNVHFLPAVTKEQMPSILKSVDCAIIPLRKLEIFEGAIPSKVFESLAMELPILLCVDGEARTHFVDKAQAAIFIEPENAEELAKQISFLSYNKNERIEMGKRGRKYAFEVFNRDNIAEKFLKQLS